MKKYLLIVAIALLSSLPSPAQEYKWSEGFAFQPASYNGASGIGVNVKQFLKNGQDLDYGLYYYFNKKGCEFNLAYEWNTRLFFDDLYLYGGPGFGFGVVSYDVNTNMHKHTTWSIMGVCGLEYVFQFAPLSLSADWRPHYRYRTYYDTWYLGLGCFNIALKIYF
ncbi:MAG: hypothetical protein MJY89_07345 [Bacteroidales bacterium]|nr:hypothetical protein [Bacteroidales bacterium]